MQGYKGRNYRGQGRATLWHSQGTRTDRHGQDREHTTATHTPTAQAQEQRAGHTTATAPQPRHRDRDTQEQGTPRTHSTRRRKNKSVHNRTSRCAIVVAWSTREQTTRSPQTTPLAPLREDMAQGIRAYAVSSFVCRRGQGNAVGTTQTQNAMRGEEGAAFLPIKYKNFLPFRYARRGRRLGNGSETEN